MENWYVEMASSDARLCLLLGREDPDMHFELYYDITREFGSPYERDLLEQGSLVFSCYNANLEQPVLTNGRS